MDKASAGSFNRLKQESIPRLIEFVSNSFLSGVNFTVEDIRLIQSTEEKGITIEITDPERLTQLAENSQPFTLQGRVQTSYEVKFTIDAAGSLWASYEGTFFDTASGSGMTLLDNTWFRGVLIVAMEELSERSEPNLEA